MEVYAAGKDIRTRQTLERQLSSVGSAADRLYLRRHTAVLHGLEHDVDNVHLRIYHLLHIVILVFHVSRNSAFAILLVHLYNAFLDEGLALLKLIAVVVADDIRQLGVLYVRLDAQQMIESFITFC